MKTYRNISALILLAATVTAGCSSSPVVERSSHTPTPVHSDPDLGELARYGSRVSASLRDGDRHTAERYRQQLYRTMGQ